MRSGNNQRAKEIADQATTAATAVNDVQRSAARTIIAVVLAEAGDVDRAIELATEIETANGQVFSSDKALVWLVIIRRRVTRP